MNVIGQIQQIRSVLLREIPCLWQPMFTFVWAICNPSKPAPRISKPETTTSIADSFCIEWFALITFTRYTFCFVFDSKTKKTFWLLKRKYFLYLNLSYHLLLIIVQSYALSKHLHDTKLQLYGILYYYIIIWYFILRVPLARSVCAWEIVISCVVTTLV